MTAGRLVLALASCLVASASALTLAPDAMPLDPNELEQQPEQLGYREASFNGSHWWLLGRAAASNQRLSGPGPKPRPWLPSPLCPTPEGAQSWSMKREDEDIYNQYFCGKRGGTYVEMGALDGLRFSNTKFFEDHMGWGGALIEASPDSLALLRENRRSKKNATKRNAIFGEAVCERGVDHLDFLVGPEPATNSASGSMPDNWLNHYHYNENESRVVQVPCRPLGTLLRSMMDKTGATSVDFFSLDVEGGELEVLKTMDWSVEVGVWMIEWGGGRTWKKEELTQLLGSHGYVLSPKGAEIYNNAIFVRR